MASTLRAHVRELHPRLRPVPRANAALARAHARAHHRLYCGHYHEPDNAGPLAGPNTTERRPSGWYDGSGVHMKRRK